MSLNFETLPAKTLLAVYNTVADANLMKPFDSKKIAVERIKKAATENGINLAAVSVDDNGKVKIATPKPAAPTGSRLAASLSRIPGRDKLKELKPNREAKASKESTPRGTPMRDAVMDALRKLPGSTRTELVAYFDKHPPVEGWGDKQDRAKHSLVRYQLWAFRDEGMVKETTEKRAIRWTLSAKAG